MTVSSGKIAFHFPMQADTAFTPSTRCRVARMHARIATLTVVLVVAGCATRTDAPQPADPQAPSSAALPAAPAAALPAVISPALSADEYKRELALHIGRKSAHRMYEGRPQALLRSVIVVRYIVDARGNLVRSEIMRSNRDPETEATALGALRAAAPFPPPAPHLLRRGQLELAETWLFNNDGRFQLRSTAMPQMDR